MKLNILLAEDNKGDVFLVHEALRAHGLEYEMHVANDGSAVEGYLKLLDITPGARYPDVFLLDLNLPESNGYDILNRFRFYPECANVPVIIISSSDAPKDRQRAELLATTYFRKPPDLMAFLLLGEVVKKVLGTAPHRDQVPCPHLRAAKAGD